MQYRRTDRPTELLRTSKGIRAEQTKDFIVRHSVYPTTMRHIFKILPLLALVFQGSFLGVVDASHFRGVMFSWKATDDSSTIDINWRISFTRTSHPCDGSLINPSENILCDQCSTQQIAPLAYQCTDYSQAENWQSGVGSTSFTIEPGITTFDISFTGGSWIGLGNGGGSYKAQAHVDLTPYNGVINSSPITSWITVYRAQQGCQVTLDIPVMDPDGDVVRCRWPSIDSERGGVTQMPNTALDGGNCMLTINALSSPGWYAIALVIEDFVSTASVTAKSKIPLQFLVNIFNSNTACSDKPALIYPTPNQGNIYRVAPGAQFSVEVRARASLAQITEIETFSPLGMATSSLSPVPGNANEYYITTTWTPTSNQMGIHIMCFSALDFDGKMSEERCVFLSVKDSSDGDPLHSPGGVWMATTSSTSSAPHQSSSQILPITANLPMVTQAPLKPSMVCSGSALTVYIPKSMIGDTLASHLHFLDPACVGSHHNGTHVKIVTTYNRCGTSMEVRGESVIFSNIIHDAAKPVKPGSVITRDRDIDVPVQCTMDMEGVAELSFRPDTSKITFSEDGFGSFNFSLSLYHGNSYITPYLAADYPVHVTFGDKLYFEARTWTEPGLELFVQTCRATPTSNPDDFHRYSFINDGCIEDNSVVFHPSYSPNVERFEMDVFAFLDTLPQPVVYVHCEMMLCNSSDSESKCAVGCPTGNLNSLHSMHRRHARSASGSRAYAITQGPISLETKEGGKEPNSGMPTVQMPVLLTIACLLVGCVLVLGGVVAVLCKRNRRLYMYQPLSMDYNDE